MATFFQIPAEFEFLHRTWRVRKLSKAKAKQYNARGLCDLEHATIYLESTLSYDDMLQTFFHELGHALVHNIGYAFATEEEEEGFVEIMGGLMAQLIKSQKGTFR